MVVILITDILVCYLMFYQFSRFETDEFEMSYKKYTSNSIVYLKVQFSGQYYLKIIMAQLNARYLLKSGLFFFP